MTSHLGWGSIDRFLSICSGKNSAEWRRRRMNACLRQMYVFIRWGFFLNSCQCCSYARNKNMTWRPQSPVASNSSCLRPNYVSSASGAITCYTQALVELTSSTKISTLPLPEEQALPVPDVISPSTHIHCSIYLLYGLSPAQEVSPSGCRKSP